MTPEKNESIDFNRKKIYETLGKSKLQPTTSVSPVVQEQIAATNGVHYIDRIGKLNEYPVYELPVERSNGGLMLDIGNGWGRWLVAGANKGYIPIGIDIRLEFCITARDTLNKLNRQGYSLVADLKDLPFKENIFDLVWSFSVIQHTHKTRMLSCLQHINRILNQNGFAFLEFPNKNGIRNRFTTVKSSESERDDYDSWCVRYYTPEEYRKIFMDTFGNFSFSNHSFLGIGILKEDLKYVSLKNKIVTAVSLLGSFGTKILPPLKNISDSLYVKAYKRQQTNDTVNVENIKHFLALHKADPSNNLNICALLQCPKTGTDIKLSSDHKKLVSEEAGIYYNVENNIPILIASEAHPL